MKLKLTSASMLLSLLAGSTSAATPGSQPRIVVGIVVDQLRTDYLEQLRPYFGNKGFNRLITEGVYMPDVDFRGTVADAPSGTAVIYTGAWPSSNGVASAFTLDASQRRSVPTLSDPSKNRLEYSPENLRVSTLADEFAVHNGTLSKIYSVAGNPQVAVIAAGHAGTSAIWLDEAIAKWNSPAYYGSALPPALANPARTSPLSSRISSTVWRPLNPASSYLDGKVWNGADFSYSFSGSGKEQIARFKGSAPFNTVVTDAAMDLLKSMQTGQPGMLNIEYSLSPISFDYDGDNRPELVDSYVRLDSELGRLLETIDREYGAGNAIIFLSSTGYATEPEIPDATAKVPTGEITLKQAESLLNSYLSASYGNADYVALIKDGKLYLDEKAVSAKGLDIKKLRNEAKDFLIRMGGVSEAFTIDEVLHSDSRRTHELALGVDAKNTPDIFLFFSPGWTVTDDNAYPSTSRKVRLSAPPTPAFLMAPDIEPLTVEYSVEATAIAPTVASALHIRSPNAAASKPLTLMRRAN